MMAIIVPRQAIIVIGMVSSIKLSALPLCSGDYCLNSQYTWIHGCILRGSSAFTSPTMLQSVRLYPMLPACLGSLAACLMQ